MAKSEILNDWESLWYIKFTDLKGEPELKDSRITFQTHNTVTVASIDTITTLFKPDSQV